MHKEGSQSGGNSFRFADGDMAMAVLLRCISTFSSGLVLQPEKSKRVGSMLEGMRRLRAKTGCDSDATDAGPLLQLMVNHDRTQQRLEEIRKQRSAPVHTSSGVCCCPSQVLEAVVC
jgi:hypothetical protein